MPFCQTHLAAMQCQKHELLAGRLYIKENATEIHSMCIKTCMSVSHDKNYKQWGWNYM